MVYQAFQGLPSNRYITNASTIYNRPPGLPLSLSGASRRARRADFQRAAPDARQIRPIQLGLTALEFAASL